MSRPTVLSFNRLARQCVTKFPVELRAPLQRKMINLNYEVPKEFSIGLPKNVEELDEAFRILHDSYVAAGYMAPHPTGMRIIPQHLLLSTTIAVARLGNEVIGTLSFVRDSFLGLPMDSIFDLSHLRRGGNRLLEVSSLAFKQKYRKEQGKLFFPLVKFAFLYARDISPVDYMVIAVNPSMDDFWRSFWLFHDLGVPTVDNYGFVKGAPAVGKYHKMDEFTERMEEAYRGARHEKNVHQYMDATTPGLDLPSRPFYKGSDSVLTPELFREFYSWRTDVLDNLSLDKQLKLAQYYSGSEFEPEIEKIFGDKVKTIQRRNDFRHEVALSARAALPGAILASNLKVVQVSKGGLLVRGMSPELKSGPVRLKVDIGPENSVSLLGETIWNREGMTGLRILQADSEWFNYQAFLEGRDQVAAKIGQLVQA